MARPMSAQISQIQREAVPGVAIVTAMKRLTAMKLVLGWEGAAEAYRGGAGKVPTAVQLTDELGAGEVAGVQDFNHLGFVLASRFSLPITTTPAGGTLARQHVFAINPDAADTKATYTAQYGDETQMLQASFGVFNSLGLTIERGALSLSSTWRSRQPSTGATPAGTNEVQTVTITGAPTGGTFTLSYAGATTAPIAFDASAAAVISALEALSTIGVGDVAGGGGPLPGTAVTVTFQGALGRRDVAQMTASGAGLTGGTTPAVAVTTTTPGVAPESVAAVPIPSNKYDVYADDLWANAGVTKLLAAYRLGLTFGDKFAGDAPINSAIVSYEDLIETEDQEYTAEALLGFDAVAVALMSTFAAGAVKFFRIAVIGPVIEAAITYLFQLDFAAAVLSRGTPTPAGAGTVSIPFGLTLIKDPVSGSIAEATLINTQLSY